MIETKLATVQVNMKAENDSLSVWAKAQGIDVSYLHKYNLGDLVKEGKITAEQKAAIEAKPVELQQKHEAARTELMQWVKDNNINPDYLKMHNGFFDSKHDHGYKKDDK